MTISILGQPVQIFIDGPKNSAEVYDNGNGEKAAHHADLSKGYEIEDYEKNIGSGYHPFDDTNERYD